MSWAALRSRTIERDTVLPGIQRLPRCDAARAGRRRSGPNSAPTWYSGLTLQLADGTGDAGLGRPAAVIASQLEPALNQQLDGRDGWFDRSGRGITAR